jgi:hypothetical protein
MTLFTVEQANRTLPLVGRIVADMVRTFERWREKVRELELASAGKLADRAPDADASRAALEREVQAIAAEIEGFEGELNDLGVRVGDASLGLVDFPCEMGGRLVYLCWQFGEPSVRYWHERDAGYAGRQPIAGRARHESRATRHA